MNLLVQRISARSANWRSLAVALLLLLLLGVVTLVGSWASPPLYAATGAQQAPVLTLNQLRNATFRSLNTITGTVQLTNGVYEDPASGIRVSLTDFFAIGDLTGDSVDDAVVILATETAEGGPFFSLVGAVSDGDELKPAGVVLLGDKVRIDQLSIANRLIPLDYARHRPTDAECCPSQRLTATYALRRGLLVPQQTKAFGLLFPFLEGRHYGYVNILGEAVIAPQFAQAGEFAEGLAAVSFDRRNTGYINQLGELVIDPIFAYGGPFRQGMAIVGVKGVDADKQFLSAFIDRDGQFVFGDARFTSAEPFSEGLAAVSFDGQRYGYIDLLGNVVIEPQFTHAESFSEGLAPARFAQSYGFIDRSGKFIIPPQFEAAEPFSSGRAQIVINGKTGYINHRGEIVIEPIYDYGGDFINGRALVTLEGKRFYIDEAGNAEIDLPNLTSGSDFAEGLAAVALDGLFGYIDLQGNIVIQPQFTYAGSFHNGLAVFETSESRGVLNNLGEIVLELPKFERPTGVTTSRVAFVPPVPAETRPGACTENSSAIGLSSAWKCTVDNQVYDPCLLADDAESVVCNLAPAEDGAGFRVELSKPLPAANVTTKMASPLWQLRLADGTSCSLLFATQLVVGGKPVTHVCSDSQVILGAVDQSSEPWTVEKASLVNNAQGDFEVESSATVGVLTAWEPTVPGQ
jgi:hypothetical protein